MATSPDFAEWTSVIAVDPTDAQRLYAGQRFELKRSAPGGGGSLTWTSIKNNGPNGQELHPDHQDLVFDPSNPSRLYLANDAGVYRSSNAGTSWEFASGQLNVAQLHDIDISQSNPDVVAGGAQESGVHYGTRGKDGVWSWHNALTFRYDGTRVAIDASDPKIVYFCSQRGWRIARSLDACVTVTDLGAPTLPLMSPFITILTLDPNPTVKDPAHNRAMLLGATLGLIPHLFRSQNGGAHWTRVEDDTGMPFVPEGEITAIEFAPLQAGVAFLGTSLGAVYRTADGGAHWELINSDTLFGIQVSAISSAPDNPAHIWVVFAGEGVTFTDHPSSPPSHRSHVYRTENGGGTWSDASGSLFTGLPRIPASAVVVDDQTTHGGRAYVGTDVGSS